jgi:catechol 2,3-dioxygenase-like lactoylglutathione lyase family enzyme
MPGVPVTGVSELVLEVADLEAAEAFYAGVLGLPVVERWQQRHAVWLMAGDRTRIGLWLGPQIGIAGGRGGAHVHFALHIEPAEYDAAVERLRAHGFDPHQEVFRGYDGSRAVYATDPDGNVVELWTFDVARHLDWLGDDSRRT